MPLLLERKVFSQGYFAMKKSKISYMLGYKTRLLAGGYRFFHIRIPTIKRKQAFNTVKQNPVPEFKVFGFKELTFLRIFQTLLL